MKQQRKETMPKKYNQKNAVGKAAYGVGFRQAKSALADERDAAPNEKNAVGKAALPLTKKQQIAYNLFCYGCNVFVTGAGGVGKSYLVRMFINNAIDRGLQVGVTSTTGVSAVLINGMTVHSYFGIKSGKDSLRHMLPAIMNNKQALYHWQNTDVIIIDEISMMDAVVLEKLDYLGRTIRNNNEFFGGMQVVLVGDLYQLPPVDYDKFGMIINSKAFNKEFRGDDHPGVVIELDEIVRQKDPVFQNLLNAIRIGKSGSLSDDTIDLLRPLCADDRQVSIQTSSGRVIEPTLLFSHRKSVESTNNKRLKELPGDIVEFRTETWFSLLSSQKRISEKQETWLYDLARKYCNAPDILELKIGAQVLLTKNLDFDNGLVNGSRGVVTDFLQENKEEFVEVSFANGAIRKIARYTWDIRVDDNTTIHRKQFPLVLAYATTIHRAQGATLDCVEVDLYGVFEYGQLYTALSRVRGISGLRIIGLDLEKLKKGGIPLAHPDVLRFFAQQKIGLQ